MRLRIIIGTVVILALIAVAIWWFAFNNHNQILGKWESPGTGIILEFTSNGSFTVDNASGVKGGNYQWTGNDTLKITSAFNLFTNAKADFDNEGNLIFENPPDLPISTYRKYKEVLFDAQAIEGPWKTMKGESNCIPANSIFFNRNGTFAAPTGRNLPANGRYVLDNIQIYTLADLNANNDTIKSNGQACRLVLSQSRITLYDRAGQIMVLVRQ